MDGVRPVSQPHRQGDILEGLRQMGTGKGVPREKMCQTMGALFSLAGNRPADTMGSVSIMDFVRSMESFVLTQVAAD